MRISDWSSDVCSSDLWIADAQLLQHRFRGLLHHLRARIVILVDAVAEAHQAERVLLVLGASDIFGDAVGRADLAQHVERGLVGAAMGRAPEAGDARGDAGGGHGAGGAVGSNRRGRAMLYMVGMEDEDGPTRLPDRSEE